MRTKLFVAIALIALLASACTVKIPDLGITVDGTPVGPLKVEVNPQGDTPMPSEPTTTPAAQPEAPVADPGPQPETCGLVFPAYSSGELNTAYDVQVECWQENGGWHMRGWQYQLPVERADHSVALQLPKGSYVLNGVSCKLYLDEARNGNGSANPLVAANDNNMSFNVSVDVAWALVECTGGPSSGFDYWR